MIPTVRACVIVDVGCVLSRWKKGYYCFILHDKFCIKYQVDIIFSKYIRV